MDSMDHDLLLERWAIEFKKGFAKPLILHFLNKQQNYPYRLTREINDVTNGAINIAGSNIYPLLKGMKDEGLIQSEKGEGSVRTIYTLTSKGKAYLEALTQEMVEFLELMLNLIQEGI
jgi:PadR family transcriptional regulator PadR